MKSVSEIINSIGVGMNPNFSIESEVLKSAYKQSYEVIFSGITKNTQSKGLLIIGSIGCGKTFMMKIYQKVFLGSLRGFKIVNSGILIDMLDEISVSEIKERYGYGCKMDLYIDDIGVKYAVSSRYGNKVNIISEILLERYELFVNEGWKTHLSTNLIPKNNSEIEDENNPTIQSVYGSRVYDRIKEMCELIVFNGKSLRK